MAKNMISGKILGSFLLTSVLLGSLSSLPLEKVYAAPSQAQNAQVVNINKATADELQTVRGIGPALAVRIVKYREEKGKFERVEDLLKVSGIRQAKLQKIKDQVSI